MTAAAAGLKITTKITAKVTVVTVTAMMMMMVRMMGSATQMGVCRRCWGCTTWSSQWLMKQGGFGSGGLCVRWVFEGWGLGGVFCVVATLAVVWVWQTGCAAASEVLQVRHQAGMLAASIA